MMYKSKILKVTQLKPMDSDEMHIGARVREWIDGKPTEKVMRIVTVAGDDILVQYVDNPVNQEA